MRLRHQAVGDTTGVFWRGLLTSAAVILVALGGLLGLVWLLQRRLLYVPAGEPPPVARVLPGAREVQLRTADDLDLTAWFLPSADPALDVTVLVANGNAGNRADRAELARRLAAAGMAVLLFDYRGFGGNPGRPSQRGLALDVRAARAFLVDDLGVPPTRLLYLGESLGTAVVTELATEYPPGGLVLRSPFLSLTAVARRHHPGLPVRALLRDRYPLLDHLPRVPTPVAVVYGTADEIVPAEQSRAVAAATLRLIGEHEILGAHHNDAQLAHGPVLVRTVAELARRL